MTDHPTPTPPLTAHAAVTRGLERALRDLGVDLVGCSPSVLSGHVIKALREAGLLRTPTADATDAVRSAADRVREAVAEWHKLFGCEFDDEPAFATNISSALYQAGMLCTSGKDEPTGVSLTAAERRRQIAEEGYDETHDDQHISGELAAAGAAYALAWPDYDSHSDIWPWTAREFKPTRDRIRDLAKASALICSEIDRLLRAARGTS